MPVIVNPPPEAPPAKRREEPKYVPAPLDPGAQPVFSVVMPAFNEEATIKKALQGLIEVMTGYGDPFEVLVVDDGSRDGTSGIVEPMSGPGTHVRLLKHDDNRGLGAALRTAFAAARGDFIVGSPVDSPLDRDQLQAFHDTMELRISFRTCLRDFNWICMYRRSIFEKVTIEFDGFSALPEILVKAKRAGFTLKQVPCPMRARKVGKGTVGRPSILIKAFAEFLRLWLRLTFGGSGRSKAEGASEQAGKEA